MSKDNELILPGQLAIMSRRLLSWSHSFPIPLSPFKQFTVPPTGVPRNNIMSSWYCSQCASAGNLGTTFTYFFEGCLLDNALGRLTNVSSIIRHQLLIASPLFRIRRLTRVVQPIHWLRIHPVTAQVAKIAPGRRFAPSIQCFLHAILLTLNDYY